MFALRYLIICALWLSLQTGIQANGSPGGDAYRKLRDADGLARKGQAAEASEIYLEAVQLYEAALKSEPDNRSLKQNHLYCLDNSGRVLITRADSLRKTGNFADATRLYFEAIERYQDAHAALEKEQFSGNIEYARVHGRSSAFKDALARKSPAPAFELPTAGDSKQTLKLIDYRGKFVLLDFFASWCPTCVKNTPKILQLQKSIGKADLAVIGVCLDDVSGFKRRGRDRTKFLQSLPVENLVALGSDEMAEVYAIERAPTMILIDREGNLVREIPYNADFDHKIGPIIQANKNPEGTLDPNRTRTDRADISELIKGAVDGRGLRTAKGIRYQAGISTPYSGWVKGTHKSGNVAALLQLKDGKANGLAIRWDKDGRKITEGAFRDNKMDGVWTEWHENGQKKGESRYRNGKIDGVLTLWRENGKKVMEGTFRSGKEISKKWWDSQGLEVETEEEALK